MMITIDPNEMVAAATTLHDCAVEAADIGSQLSSSAAQAMPPELQHVVDQMVVTVDRALDAVAIRLDAQSADLNARAQIAANDSVAAAAAAATPAAFRRGQRQRLVGRHRSMDGSDERERVGRISGRDGFVDGGCVG